MAGVATKEVTENDIVVEEDAREVRPAIRRLPPPLPAVKTKAPAQHEWRTNLRELPRGAKMCVEDFGLTKSTIARFAERAKKGDQKAAEKLEPLKQVFLDLMGLDQEERPIRSEDTNQFVLNEPITTGKRAISCMKTRTRSKWGISDRDGDLYHVAEKGPRPKPGKYFNMVNEHFYDLVQLLEFLKKTPDRVIQGRKPPNPEAYQEALANALNPQTDADRAWAVEFIGPYLKGKRAEWDGRS